MQVVEVLETLLDRLRHRDRLGIGQRAVVAARTGDHVAEQTDVGRRQAGVARQQPERVQIALAHVGQHQVLLVGDADFAEAEALRPVRHGVHLRRVDIPRRRRRAGLGRQHHARVARHLVRTDVVLDPASEGRIARQLRTEGEVDAAQRFVGRRAERARDALVFGVGQLGRAVLDLLPFALDFLGERLDAQRPDEDLDPRLVLVVAPAVAVVDPQHGFDVGQQVTPGQRLADRLAEDRRAPEAAADHHPQAHFAGAVAIQVEADVVHADRRAILQRRAQGDLELARQEEEFGVHRRPLAEDLRQWARVDQLVGGDAGEGLGGDVAHAVAGGLDGVHVDLGEVLQDVWRLRQLDPVELDVLPRGEVPVAAVVTPGDQRQRAQLSRRQRAVGNRHAQHVGVLLQVQAVLQAQREELLLAELAIEAPRHLVAKLRHAFVDQCPVIVVVQVHPEHPRCAHRTRGRRKAVRFGRWEADYARSRRT